MGWADSKETILIKSPLIHIDEDPNEHRMPSQPIQCTISEDGIFIYGYEVDEILSFEVYDLDGNCVLMTDEARIFVTYIYSTSEEFEIKIFTKDSLLRGYIYGG